MRSRSARASATSPSSLTTTAAGSCGPVPAATARPSRSSWICSAKSAATRSSWCPATWPRGSPDRSPSAARNASVCYDPFHLIKLSTDALDEIRREVWNEARRQGQAQLANELKGARFALWKNPSNLTERQQLKLARVQQLNQRLYRAYLLSQQLREIYRVGLADAIALLDAWLAWARRSRLAPFVKLAKTITEQRSGIEAAIRNGLSNARVEQVNTQLRLITRRAFGFHSPHAAIALAMLALGGLCPPLPGR
jgi:transposase